MQFVKPILFEDAVEKLGEKSVIGSKLNSLDWSNVPLALRDRAFFSSRVESVRFLQNAKDFISDFLKGTKVEIEGPDGKKRTGLKAGSRAQFVKEMREFAIANGLGPLDPKDKGTIKDITSERRLSLIFDTQTKAAHDYGYWKQGMDPDLINEFPAQRFIREADVIKPRVVHQMNEGVVRLKTDLQFWLALNSPAFGGFGVPWGPWGFNSGMGVEDVDRDEAEALGLIKPGEQLQPVEKDFNEHLQASVRNLDPVMIKHLQSSFGDQVKIEGGSAWWTGSRRPEPAPAPEPAPVPTPTPTPADKPKLEDLVSEYDATTDPQRRRDLIERSRVAIEIPTSERGSVRLTTRTNKKDVQKVAAEGSEIVSRYVSKKLLQNVALEVKAISTSRAFYREGTINLSSYTGANVAAHEIMHGVEDMNPQVLKAARDFLLKRGGGRPARSLRSLTGLPFRASEIALEDEWVKKGGTVYAGKVYGLVSMPSTIRYTEIMTTGIERLHANPIEFYKNDPEWFNFMISTLQSL